MSNENTQQSTQVEIFQNVDIFDVEQGKKEKENVPNKNAITIRNSDNVTVIDEAFVPSDDNNKNGDKKDANKLQKYFTLYGYYVRAPIWVNAQYESSDHYDDGGAGGSYDPKTRNPFIRLVFIIVFIMLLFTVAWTAMCMNLTEIQKMYKAYGIWLLVVSIVGMLGISIVMACCSCTRYFPWNYICLVLSVIFMSLLVGYFVIRYEGVLVMLAVVATAALVFVCFLLALTNFDFTRWLMYVIVIMVVLSVIGLGVFIVQVITKQSFTILSLVTICVATVVHAIMLVIEIQMVLGGKTVELEDDEYALGAYMIYTSIVDLFIKFLQMFGLIDMLS